MEDWLDKLIAHEARYFAFLAQREETPCALFLTSSERPDYHDANRALRLRDDGRGPETVAREVIAYFRARGRTVVVDVDAVAEAQGIGAALRRLGVTPLVGANLLMRYPLDRPPQGLPGPVEVRVVPDDRETEAARLWIEMQMSDLAGDKEEAMWRAVAEHEARSPDCRLYLGRLNGEPAGACDLFAAEGWGRIDSVVTRLPMRRRGVASALVAQAVADSLQMDHEVTYLFAEAGGAGESVYTRLGFEVWQRDPLRR
ncbi:MAG TPA: GNAT family N-acetyltransferase, partial [Chthonomonadaceae bacterium]|nr:GNAT family N-acetyltransferase [Chthonomonadaceae bacterium]